jgi:uncharacterized membrane protein
MKSELTMLFQNMPLHALVVHLPIALTMLIPLFVALAFLLTRRGVAPQRAWMLPTGLLALLLVSGWAALQTGQQQEDRVERVVPEAAFETHEEAAELFLIITGGVLVLAAGGLMNNRAGKALRVAGAAGTLVVLGAGYNVGHSGGKLVYQYGAARAYAAPAGSTGATRASHLVPALSAP